MAQQVRKTQRKDSTREVFMLLMLSVVLVFAFGLIIGKQESSSMPQAETVTPTESMTEMPSEETVPEVKQADGDSAPEFKQATSFWSVKPHIYLRVNHEKQIEISGEPEFDLSEAIYGVSDENIAMIDEAGRITGVSKGECTVSVFCGTETLRIPVTVRELTVQDGCTYVDGILIANKSISLPETYDPGMLPVTEEAFSRLQADAAELGLNIYEGSGYRDYQYQITCYNSLVETYGEEYANRISAKPGHSEHQTGYTVDCNSINETFINTPEGQWLDEHCHEYGFIIRYPEGKEDITGYAYECWHIRYVGIEVATEIHEQGLTLEEYLDVESIETEPVTEPETVPEAEMPSDENMQESMSVSEEETDTQEETQPVMTEDPQIIDAPMEAP